MEVTFNVTLDFGKNKSNAKDGKCCNCSSHEESNLEKWLDTAQKFVKTIKVK